MSEVFCAVEISTGRPVALKMLKVESAQPAMLDAFAEEVRVLGAVSSHPNVVTLYRTVTTAAGRPTLVLELCRGSLAEQLRSVGPLTSRDVLALGIKLAGALETAHRAGFLHRDVKPEAVLLTQFGEPVLSDFGVAVLHGAANGPRDGFAADLVYAAPEALEDRPLSPATDVYGLAATLYEALSGRGPFVVYEGESPASVILRILRDPVAPLRGDDLALGLAELLEVSLAKEPGIRPTTAADFAAALAAVEAERGWPATPYVVWGEAAQPLLGASPVPSHKAPGPAPSPAVLAGPMPVAADAGEVFAQPVGAGDPPGPSVLAAVATPRNVIPPARADLPSPPEPAGAGRPQEGGLAAPPEPPIPLPGWPDGDAGWPGPPRPWPGAYGPTGPGGAHEPAAPPLWNGPPAQWTPAEGPPGLAQVAPAPAAPGAWPPPPAPATPSGQPSPPAGWCPVPLPSTLPGDWQPPPEAVPRWAPPEGGWPPPAPPQPAVGWPGPPAGTPAPREGSRKRRWRPRRER